METTTVAGKELSSEAQGVEATTLTEAFQNSARDYPDRVAIRTKGDEYSATWGEHAENVRQARRRGWPRSGLERGQTIALMLTNRPEFHVLDAAAMHLGATPFSVYNTYSPEQIEYLVLRRGEQDRHHRAGVPRHGPRGAGEAAGGSSTWCVVDGEPDGTVSMAELLDKGG